MKRGRTPLLVFVAAPIGIAVVLFSYANLTGRDQIRSGSDQVTAPQKHKAPKAVAHRTKSPPREPDSSATGTKKNDDNSTDLKPRLEWSPQPSVDQETVFDLCDDDAAIEAGLDGGDLVGDRAVMGVHCDSSTNRYAHRDAAGNLVVGRGSQPSAGSPEAGSTEPPSLMMGYRGPSFENFKAPEGSTNPLVVDPASVRTVDGVTYGLVVNTSDQLAENLVVEHGGVRSKYPLSVQPGEAAPFVLEVGADELNASAITPEASLLDSVDTRRAILVNAVPGIWHGPREQLPAPAGLIDIEAAPAEVTYYETSFEVKPPTSHSDVAAAVESRPIEDVEVVVAFLDSEASVLGVINPKPVKVNNEGKAEPTATIKTGDLLTVGFLMPPEASDLAIWIGGTKQ